MDEFQELTRRDRRLLRKVDAILCGGGKEREAESVEGFCAHLASTVPQAGETFEARLEARLLARMRQQQSASNQVYLATDTPDRDEPKVDRVRGRLERLRDLGHRYRRYLQFDKTVSSRSRAQVASERAVQTRPRAFS
ncbi:MAG: hypothetical protein M3281_08620, partial [Chloroflexota bacterium]|nr:hypothetical protein [Chloroflexota bacterium]